MFYVTPEELQAKNSQFTIHNSQLMFVYHCHSERSEESISCEKDSSPAARNDSQTQLGYLSCVCCRCLFIVSLKELQAKGLAYVVCLRFRWNGATPEKLQIKVAPHLPPKGAPSPTGKVYCCNYLPFSIQQNRHAKQTSYLPRENH